MQYFLVNAMRIVRIHTQTYPSIPSKLADECYLEAENNWMICVGSVFCGVFKLVVLFFAEAEYHEGDDVAVSVGKYKVQDVDYGYGRGSARFPMITLKHGMRNCEEMPFQGRFSGRLGGIEWDHVHTRKLPPELYARPQGFQHRFLLFRYIRYIILLAVRVSMDMKMVF
ncbi:hypothetical protein RB195_010209 [Necator americanus]|uniref:Uncharacterized protein n=1 Tax=Necator americanus TaxID=51031 RepID=A0ABR1CYC0_NECAM